MKRGEGKNSGIYFKVSGQERQLIEQRMAEAGVSNVSAYIRKMCLNGLIVRLDIPQIPDCSKYLKSASNNLNHDVFYKGQLTMLPENIS